MVGVSCCTPLEAPEPYVLIVAMPHEFVARRSGSPLSRQASYETPYRHLKRSSVEVVVVGTLEPTKTSAVGVRAELTCLPWNNVEAVLRL